MLTENQIHSLQSFQNLVIELDRALHLAAPGCSELAQSLRSLQKLFQAEIQPIQSDHYQTHSVLVEINKQMRLLNMDGMFLQTARQVETIETRIGQIRDRVQLLTNYCAVILATEPD